MNADERRWENWHFVLLYAVSVIQGAGLGSYIAASGIREHGFDALMTSVVGVILTCVGGLGLFLFRLFFRSLFHSGQTQKSIGRFPV